MAKALEAKDVLEANADFEERLRGLHKVSVSYDKEFDIFLLTLGEPQEAITEEIHDGLQLRLDPESLKIVGFEILGFRRRYLKTHPEFLPHFEALFEESPIERREISPSGRRAKEAVRELIPIG